MSAAPTVQVISRDGCQPCVATHRRLAKLQVDYTSVDASDETAIAQARELGHLELPVVIVSDETGVIDSWAGFSPDRLSALAASHTPKKEHRMSENNTPEATAATRTITVDGMQIELIGRESILDRGEAGLRAGWEADKAARQADEPEEDEDAEEAYEALVELVAEVAVGYTVERAAIASGQEQVSVTDPEARESITTTVKISDETGKPFSPEALRASLPTQLREIQGLADWIEHVFEDDDTDYSDPSPHGFDDQYTADREFYYGQDDILARHNALEARLAQISAE
ncbi:hypothetical protein Sked_28890 [Sanguibacter keddieii DSM 10542]|uniref:Glutaredoxin-like protein n=1 Tax=Sanguibacter keddieii (strain ATCC 51767 / DSM 10542 / NCFB 3025 / ST-74) TaxID=446469 RepID=D1BBM0_SANKS|nr:glutaredoxin family protein [Sanguibacter keddieii]ACZ22791.1 hypothetical protein Sked_28890 [Sanguibacter keddieii DSM 10542]